MLEMNEKADGWIAIERSREEMKAEGRKVSSCAGTPETEKDKLKTRTSTKATPEEAKCDSKNLNENQHGGAFTSVFPSISVWSLPFFLF